jgi:HTH-type transcriptional regulator / antitoxin HigA
MSAEIDFIPAEAFPPGDFLREELNERGWTQIDFADILGRPLQLVNEVVLGKREITPATAQAFAAALGTSAQFWLNLETAYRLYLESRKQTADTTVSRRAKLYTKAPVKEMVRRGWIESSSDVEVLEKKICQFFEIKSIDDEPRFMPHAARKSSSYGSVNPTMRAWLFRARQLARVVAPTGRFKNDSVARVVEKLKLLLYAPLETRQVSRILSEHGIRLIVIETIGDAKVDGVTFWLDAKSPVIAISLRYDRIDSFWFTLIHELVHIHNGEGKAEPIIDDFDVKTADLPENERRANETTQAWLVPQDELTDFIARTQPLYSKLKIENFARRIKVHPGVIVGQLQHRREIGFSHHRKFLVKVRAAVIGSTLTDGWGTPLNL